MLFIAEVTEAKVLGNGEALTYAYYQSNVKPQAGGAAAGCAGGAASGAAGEQKPVKGWRCKICGYEFTGAELPADFECPICGHPAEDFEPFYE